MICVETDAHQQAFDGREIRIGRVHEARGKAPRQLGLWRCTRVLARNYPHERLLTACNSAGRQGSADL